MGNSVPTKALVLTVGVGRDVVRSLRLALEHHNPSFVLFLCTPQSRPHVDALLSQHPPVPDHHVEAFTETADAEKLALLYEDVIRNQLFRKRGLRPEQVYVDYTRGTKAMSAAADYVAIDLELAGVSYITGDTDERGQVITGTERLLSFRPLDLIFRRSWRTLADLFNRGHFASVIDRVTALRPRTVREDHRRRLDFVGELSRACAAWEVLDYDGACRYFREVLREFGDVVEHLDLRPVVQQASNTVHGIWSTRCLAPGCGCGLPLSPQTGPDLLAHADRRAGEHRHDVAVALLYRLMEYMAQRRLHDRGLRTDAVRLDRLPDSVQARWHARAERDGRLKLGMVQAFELLADLGDPLGARFADLYWTPDSTLRGYLEARNMSPLAHGFQPVGADVYGKLRALLTREFLSQVVADWESWLPRCQLPRLPEEA